MPASMWLRISSQNAGHSGQSKRPIDWTDDGATVDDFRDDRGRVVKDRVPALGFDGSDIHNMRPIKGVRHYVDYLRHDGHIGHVKMTNAAAHVPDHDKSYQQDRVNKARYFGWIEWPSTGISKCPLVMLAAGEINKEQLDAPELRRTAETVEEKAAEKATADAWRGQVPLADVRWWGRSCPPGHCGPGKPPCIHALAERKARRLARRTEVISREAAAKSEEAKAAIAAAVASQKQTAVLADLERTLAAQAPSDKKK